MPTRPRGGTKPGKRKEAAQPKVRAGLPWESVPDGMYRLRGAHGTIEFLSTAFGLLTGWSVNEWVGRSFAELVHPEDLPEAAARYEATCRGESVPPYELRVRTRAGDYRLGEVHSAPYVEDGRVVGEIGIVRDVTERRATEKALRESEARFRLMLEAALEGIGLLEDGRVVDCNEDLAAMLGYTRDEVIGRSVFDFVAPEDTANVAERMRSGPMGPSEQRARRKDGSTFHVEVQGRPLPYQGRQLRVVAIRDITERRRAELVQHAIFRISEAAHTVVSLQDLFAALHRIVGELMPARNFYIALYDAETDTLSFPYFQDQYDDTPAPKPPGRGLTEYVLRTGRPLLATPEVSRELERRGEVELIGAPSLDWLGVPLVAAGKTTGILVVQTYEEGVRYSTGDLDLLQFVSAEIAMAVERKRAEQASRESEEQFRQLVEHMHDALIRDDVAGNITFANDQFLALFGFERSQLRHLTLGDYVAPEWRERLRERHDRRLRGEAVPGTYEFEGIGHDGRRLWLEVDVVPLRDRSGRPIGTQSAIRDISERKALEAQLRQAQKMEAVGHLAGGVAHDFNNLLTTILASHELLSAELPADGAHAEELETIHQAARRAAELTRNLLAFSRQQAIELRAVPLGELVGGFARLARRILPEDIEVAVQVGTPDSVVHADSGAVEQMLMNLVTNSRDAMPGGGTLRLAVGREVLDEEFRRAHGWGKPGDYVVLTVADTGRGMEPKTLQRIFEPFFTTKPVGAGTGLGMAMVYGLVKQHDGFINVTSEPGQGTTVRIYFPALAESASPAPVVAASATRGGDETILLVEDDATLKRTATRVLEKYGYTVTTAADGLDALNIIRTGQAAPDLIISDVVMPHVSGPQLLSALRDAGATPRMLFTSGYATRDVRERALLESGVPFLSKPWTIAELLRKVREVLEAPPAG
ncbi:MAG TPA: PAS domain S-box protein [Gemmatimonadales bacterium]|nr:PAS domain S-box protein [Gemmatimonadales bacterium]